MLVGRTRSAAHSRLPFAGSLVRAENTLKWFGSDVATTSGRVGLRVRVASELTLHLGPEPHQASPSPWRWERGRGSQVHQDGPIVSARRHGWRGSGPQ